MPASPSKCAATVRTSGRPYALERRRFGSLSARASRTGSTLVCSESGGSLLLLPVRMRLCALLPHRDEHLPRVGHGPGMRGNRAPRDDCFRHLDERTIPMATRESPARRPADRCSAMNAPVGRSTGRTIAIAGWEAPGRPPRPSRRALRSLVLPVRTYVPTPLGGAQSTRPPGRAQRETSS
jgi:hypothetical protein